MDLKQQLLDDILLKIATVIRVEQLRVIEDILMKAFKDVEIIAMETALSTKHDDNNYLLQLFYVDRIKSGRSEKTVKQYVSSMQKMLIVVDKNIRDITTMDIQHYLQHCFSSGLQVKSVNNERRFLSASFTWFRKHGIILENPVERIDVFKEIKKPIEYLEEHEIELLRDVCKDRRERALFEFLLSTGARVGEIPLINIRDIDWNSGRIMILGEKGSKWRYVFLNDKAKVQLKKYIDSRADNNPSVFVCSRSPFKTLQDSGIQDIISQIGKRSEVDKRIYPHLLRHTLATIMRKRGAKLEDIQSILGHSTPAVTIAFYAAADITQLQNSHACYTG